MSKSLTLVLVGSFDPITIGHVSLLTKAKEYYQKNGRTVQNGLIVPTSSKYPYKKLTSFSHRICMAMIATEKYSWIIVDTIEGEHDEWMRTRNVLEKLKTKYIDTDLVFICGSDKMYEFFDKWKKDDVKYIVDNYGLFVIGRSGHEYIDDFKSKFDTDGEIICIDNDEMFSDISSTKTRNDLREKSTSEYLDSHVVLYINNNCLYK